MTKSKSGSKEGKGGDSPTQPIDARIEELGRLAGRDARSDRALIKEADPEVIEEWKWRGVPVWYHGGMICTGETYKKAVKMTFAKWRLTGGPVRPLNSASRATPGVPSIFMRTTRSMRRH